MLDYLALVIRALRFWTRIDIPVQAFEIDPHAPPMMNELAPAVPVAGALVGLAGGLVLWLAAILGLPPLLAAVLALAALVLITGAMHEDGLADIADAFGGGRTLAHKLEILKDPRLGSYGVTALALVLIGRAAALAALLPMVGGWRSAAALVAAASLSRIAGLWPLHALSPARLDGAGASTGGLSFVPWRNGCLIGVAIALSGGLAAVGIVGTLCALIAAAIAVQVVTGMAKRQIGGYTGDVCGAATILAETAFLAALFIHIW